MRWRLLLKEYGPNFLYKKGSENCIADALSRVPTMEGMDRLELTIKRHFWYHHLWTEIWTQLSKCGICATMKKKAVKEGQLAP